MGEFKLPRRDVFLLFTVRSLNTMSW